MVELKLAGMEPVKLELLMSSDCRAVSLHQRATLSIQSKKR